MMKKSFFAVVCIVLTTLTSCESETSYEWDEESRISEYVNWIDGVVCRQMVDNLDFLFQASAYRDSLLCGGDTEAVIKRQFSNPHLMPPQFNEVGEISGFKTAAEHFISHNGISLEEDGSVWVALGKMQRSWDAYEQPAEEYCQWSVRRENGVYTLTGGMIHNGTFQEFFTMSNFLGLNFTTSIAEVLVTTDFDNNRQEVKQTLRYHFNGDLMAVAAGWEDSDRLQRPDAMITLEGVAGHNAKEYIDGIPVFGAPYFTQGALSATLANGKATSWRIVIDYAQGGYNYVALE